MNNQTWQERIEGMKYKETEPHSGSTFSKVEAYTRQEYNQAITDLTPIIAEEIEKAEERGRVRGIKQAQARLTCGSDYEHECKNEISHELITLALQALIENKS